MSDSIDFEKELSDAKQRHELLVQEVFKSQGAISVLEYILRKNKENTGDKNKCSTEAISPSSSPDTIGRD